MALIQIGTENGSTLGNPTTGDFYIFIDSNNANKYTLRDSTGTDTILGGGGDLLSTNNLSDVANAVTSLSNLGGEPAFSKNTGFNKNLGTTAGTVLEGDKNAAIVLNTAKSTNATHTGDVTGSGALTVDSTAISNKASVTAASGMEVLVNDAGTLKKADADDFLGGTTNLGATANGTSLTVTSSTGTNATIPAVTTSAWGAMTDEDKTKLDGIRDGADRYYSQNLIDTTGGTIDAPYGTPAILTSSANFYITVANSGTYIVYGSVNIDDDLNKDNNALELVYGIDTGSGAVIGPEPYQQNLQAKKNKRNGIQGTWLGVSLSSGDKVHMYMSTCDDSCTWLGGRIFIAQWK